MKQADCELNNDFLLKQMTRLTLNVVLSFLSVVSYGFIVVSKIKFVLRVFLLFKALLVLSGTEKSYLNRSCLPLQLRVCWSWTWVY